MKLFVYESRPHTNKHFVSKISLHVELLQTLLAIIAFDNDSDEDGARTIMTMIMKL